MANKNFVVHNGLTVGPLTIDALTGDITTSGNLTLSGGGSIAVSNVAVSSIGQGDTSVSIVDTGVGSTVSIIVDGTTEHTVDANGVNIASGDRYAIAGNSVLSATTLGTGVVNSSLTTVGTLTALAVSGNITVGNGSATGIVKSNGAYDLKLTTNDGSTNAPAITLVQSDDGDIEFNPSGVGVVKVLSAAIIGDGTTQANLSTNGAYDLVISTNRDLGRAYIRVNSETSGNIDFSLNGTGTVNLPKITFGDLSTQDTAVIVAGNSNEVQFNSGGDLASNSDFTFDAGTSTMEVTGTIKISGAIAATTDDATALAIALG